MLFGNRLKSLLLGTCLLLALAVPVQSDQNDDRAISAALNFASLLDDGNFQAAYWTGSPLFQLANDEQLWVDKVARSQRVLGKALGREVGNIRSVTSPPELPDDDYRIILFHTRTEHKARAAEIITLHQDKGFWKVCSYAIR